MKISCCLFAFLGVIPVSGCSTLDERMAIFGRYLDSRVGREVTFEIREPKEIRHVDPATDEYFYSKIRKNWYGYCAWSYKVDPISNTVLSWHISSDPRACQP